MRSINIHPAHACTGEAARRDPPARIHSPKIILSSLPALPCCRRERMSRLFSFFFFLRPELYGKICCEESLGFCQMLDGVGARLATVDGPQAAQRLSSSFRSETARANPENFVCPPPLASSLTFLSPVPLSRPFSRSNYDTAYPHLVTNNPLSSFSTSLLSLHICHPLRPVHLSIF